MTAQTEAQRLASTTPSLRGGDWGDQAAAELRRLEAANAELKREAWEWTKALEAEREACAIVAEQGFRYAKDGYAIADDIRARGEA